MWLGLTPFLRLLVSLYMARISIKVIGELTVLRDGCPVALPPSKRARALLGYLARTGRPHRRNRLCDVFWSLAEDPRGALRWALSKLRPLVNDSECERLDADRERVALIASDVEIDIVEFSNSVDDPNITVAELRTISESLQEPFLDGLELPDLDLYQRWLVAEREGVNRLRGRVLARLASHPEISLPEKLRWASEWEEIEPYSTDAASRLVCLLNAMSEKQRADNLKTKFSLRFKNAGICWSPSKDAESSNVSGTELEPMKAGPSFARKEGGAANKAVDGLQISTISIDGTGYNSNYRNVKNHLSESRSGYLKQLEEENHRLRKIVADLSLDKAMLQDAVTRKTNISFSESFNKVQN